MQRFQRLRQVAIVSGLIDRLVEAAVERDVQHIVAFGGAEFLLELIQRRNLRGAGVHGSEPCGRALQDFSHRIELNDLLMTELRYQETAPRAKDQNAALLQALQRLTDRRAADPKIARDFLFAHALAAGDTAV